MRCLPGDESVCAPAPELQHSLSEENPGVCEHIVLEKDNVAGGCYLITSCLLSWRVDHYH